MCVCLCVCVRMRAGVCGCVCVCGPGGRWALAAAGRDSLKNNKNPTVMWGTILPPSSLGAQPPGFRTRCISENTSAAEARDVGLKVG